MEFHFRDLSIIGISKDSNTKREFTYNQMAVIKRSVFRI